MSQTVRSVSVMAAVLSSLFILGTAERTASGPARPAPVNKVFVAIASVEPSRKSVLVATPNRNCAKLIAVPSARITRGGSTVPFSSIEEGLQLDCKGVWDTSTSPMSFRATRIVIGGRVMKKKPVTHPRWKVPVDKSRKQAYSAKHSPAVHTAQQETQAAPQLELSDWKWEHGPASSVVRGRIKNLTKSTFPNVVGVVRYCTSGGRLVVSDSLVVGGNELMPGEACGFELKTTWAPGYSPTVAKADIEFHCASGKLVVRNMSLNPQHALGKP